MDLDALQGHCQMSAANQSQAEAFIARAETYGYAERNSGPDVLNDLAEIIGAYVRDE